MPEHPSIPTPTNSADALYKSTMALKQTVDRLVLTTPRMTVQPTEPQAFATGDFWLCVRDKTTLSIAVGNKWVLVGSLV